MRIVHLSRLHRLTVRRILLDVFLQRLAQCVFFPDLLRWCVQPS